MPDQARHDVSLTVSKLLQRAGSECTGIAFILSGIEGFSRGFDRHHGEILLAGRGSPRGLQMILTTRFVVFLAVGAVLFGASQWLQWLSLPGVGFAAFALAGALVDRARLREAVIEVTRSFDERLSLGADNPVAIRIANRGAILANGMVRDEHPEGFSADGNVMPFRIEPGRECEIIYRVTPPRRGDFPFGDTYIRLMGALGFASRQMRFATAAPVKVYPNLLDIRSYDAGLRRHRPLEPGRRPARVRGRGTEFESLRDYLPDDELRDVDWKATARRGKLVTRLYEEERSRNVLIALDCGRVMGSIVDGLTRLDHAVNAAAMLAHAAASRGDRVGFLAFATGVSVFLPPRPGRQQSMAIVERTYALRETTNESDYARAVAYLTGRISRRSLIVFLTDFADPASSEPLAVRISTLARKHVCVCAGIHDPVLTRNPVADCVDDAYRSAAARQASRARKEAAAALTASGAVVVDASPGELTRVVMEQYASAKSGGRF